MNSLDPILTSSHTFSKTFSGRKSKKTRKAKNPHLRMTSDLIYRANFLNENSFLYYRKESNFLHSRENSRV